eukprot:4657797-Alexandrium_andersonii.AAC.1
MVACVCVCVRAPSCVRAFHAWCPARVALACAVTYLDAHERRTGARRGHTPVMADACSHGSGFAL